MKPLILETPKLKRQKKRLFRGKNRGQSNHFVFDLPFFLMELHKAGLSSVKMVF